LGRGLAFLERHRETFLQEAVWEPFSVEEIEEVEGRCRSMGDWSSDEATRFSTGSSGCRTSHRLGAGIATFDDFEGIVPTMGVEAEQSLLSRWTTDPAISRGRTGA